MPTASGLACITDTQNASMVCPESVRPLRSVMVADRMIGTFPSGSTSDAASSAALALSVSMIVSMSSTSTPPSMSPRTCSANASFIWSKVTARNAGSLTSGEIDSVLLVGPIAPATKRGLSGVVHLTAACFASFAASTLSSYTCGSSA